MPGHSHDERQMILELFPGTSPKLLPPGEVLYFRDPQGRVHLHEEPHHAIFEPLEATPSVAPVVCDACYRHLNRAAVQFFRAQIDTAGRHFRYATLCLDTAQCAQSARPGRLRDLLMRGILP